MALDYRVRSMKRDVPPAKLVVLHRYAIRGVGKKKIK
jgi:hypothetical protein